MPLLFRKRIKLGPFVINLSRSGLSWGFDIGPWSWNSRTRRQRLDLPGPLYWQSRSRGRRRR